MNKTKYWWIIAVAVIVALLAPLQQARAGATAQASSPGVAPYSGLSQAQRANLLSIARQTWRFYNLDIDSATNLPMIPSKEPLVKKTTTWGRSVSSATADIDCAVA